MDNLENFAILVNSKSNKPFDTKLYFLRGSWLDEPGLIYQAGLCSSITINVSEGSVNCSFDINGICLKKMDLIPDLSGINIFVNGSTADDVWVATDKGILKGLGNRLNSIGPISFLYFNASVNKPNNLFYANTTSPIYLEERLLSLEDIPDWVNISYK